MMLKNIIRLSAIGLAAFILFECDKYEFPKRPYPHIQSLPVENITRTGVEFYGNIIDFADEPVINHGVVWGLSPNLALKNDDNVQLGKTTAVGIFSHNVKSGLFKDTTYYVRAFVATKKYIVYGEPLKFRSLGSEIPVIKSISPLQGMEGDTIVIRGKYFSSSRFINVVKFGDLQIFNLYSNDSTINCVVPYSAAPTTVPISLTVCNYQAVSNYQFTYLK
jgi:hypothetical protein